jgi:hypothetical protein
MKLPAASGGVSSGTRRRSDELWRAKLRRSQPVFALESFRLLRDRSTRFASPFIPAIRLRRTGYSGEDE